MKDKEKGNSNKLQGADLELALGRITGEEWIKISIILRNMCERRINSIYPHYRHFLVAAELVNEAAQAVFEGRRFWDGKNANTLCGALWYTIKSIISHKIEREKKKEAVLAWYSTTSPPNGYRHWDGDLTVFLEGILLKIEDPNAAKILKALIEKPDSTTSDISEITAIPINIINNVKKKLRRILKEKRDLFREDVSKKNFEEHSVSKSFNYDQTSDSDSSSG